MINDNKDRIEHALKLDLGKAAFESFLWVVFTLSQFKPINSTIAIYLSYEVVVALQEAVTAYKNIEQWTKDEKVAFHLDSFALGPKIRKEPKGVVLNISYVVSKNSTIYSNINFV